MVCALPIAAPPVSHVVVDAAASGPHRWNVRLALYEDTPVTVTTALSDVDRVPDAGMTFEVPVGVGVVTVVEEHSPSVPSAKSKSVAVSDCDERVSPVKVLKHLPAR